MERWSDGRWGHECRHAKGWLTASSGEVFEGRLLILVLGATTALYMPFSSMIAITPGGPTKIAWRESMLDEFLRNPIKAVVFILLGMMVGMLLRWLVA